MTVRTFTALSLAGTMLLSSAAFAQDADLQPEAAVIPDNVQTAFVYGDDAAPPCPEDAICVVARLPDGDRYRIPSNLRFSDNPANDSWTQRVEKLELVGNFGALSCSPVGAGGFTGCTQQLVDAAFADKRNGENVRFSQLIQAAREERLSTIDEDAAAEQSRVEQIEREYLERLERERAAPTPGDGAEGDLPPVGPDASEGPEG